MAIYQNNFNFRTNKRNTETGTLKTGTDNERINQITQLGFKGGNNTVADIIKAQEFNYLFELISENLKNVANSFVEVKREIDANTTTNRAQGTHIANLQAILGIGANQTKRSGENTALERISTAEGTIRTLQGNVSSLTSDIGNNGASGTVKGRLSLVEQNANNNASLLGRVRDFIGINATETKGSGENSIRVRLSGIDGKVRQNENSISTINSQIGTSDTTAGTLRYRVTSLENTSTQNQNNISSLQSKTRTLEETNTRLDSRTKRINEQIGDFEHKMFREASIVDALNFIRGEVTSLQSNKVNNSTLSQYWNRRNNESFNTYLTANKGARLNFQLSDSKTVYFGEYGGTFALRDGQGNTWIDIGENNLYTSTLKTYIDGRTDAVIGELRDTVNILKKKLLDDKLILSSKNFINKLSYRNERGSGGSGGLIYRQENKNFAKLRWLNGTGDLFFGDSGTNKVFGFVVVFKFNGRELRAFIDYTDFQNYYRRSGSSDPQYLIGFRENEYNVWTRYGSLQNALSGERDGEVRGKFSVNYYNSHIFTFQVNNAEFNFDLAEQYAFKKEWEAVDAKLLEKKPFSEFFQNKDYVPDYKEGTTNLSQIPKKIKISKLYLHFFRNGERECYYFINRDAMEYEITFFDNNTIKTRGRLPVDVEVVTLNGAFTNRTQE